MGDVSLVGYHGTCSSARANIQRKGLDPAETHNRSDHWLGQGVYFFEEQGHAHSWALRVTSPKKNIGTFPIVYRADIVADEAQVIDFDDNDNISRFIAFARDIQLAIREECLKKGVGYPILNDETTRALFFDYYKREYGIKVMIRTYCWNYDRRVSNALQYTNDEEKVETQKNFTRILGLRFNERQICVSDKDCIKNCVIVYDGEEVDVI